MGQTLTNGIYLPDEGERNSYSGLEVNWRTLDALILTVNGKAAPNIANTWTAAQTFTAGIAGDLTGNVTGNVTGDLTGTAAKAIADEDGTSIKTGYVNVAGNQTVSGDKSFTGSNTFNNILPNATNSYSLGTSTNQWSAVYAQTYYYNGTAWGLDQANVWSKLQTFKGEYLGREYTNNYCTCFGICGTNDTLSKSGMFFTRCRPNKTQGSLGSSDLVQYGVDVLENEVNTTNVFDIRVGGYNSNTGKFTKTEVISTLTDANLGTSTYKWKTINGCEPSALGEIYAANAVTIDTTNWILDGSVWNTLDTSIMSGWFYFAVQDCDADSFILFRRGSNKAKNPTVGFHPNLANTGIYYLYGLFMVPKNTVCSILIKTGTNGVLSQALLYPCLGNV